MAIVADGPPMRRTTALSGRRSPLKRLVRRRLRLSPTSNGKEAKPSNKAAHHKNQQEDIGSRERTTVFS